MASTDALANDLAFNSKRNQFRKNRKYCDICVEVEGKLFHCHRLVLAAASDYFDTLFGGNESTTDNIIVQNIDAAIFEEILQFIYCGEVTLTKDNVFNLLLASEFLALVGLEEKCLQFSRKNFALLDMFEMLTYASQLRKNSLLDVVNEYLAQNIDHHYTDFNSKQNQFRENRKYCDICVEVGGKFFHCHRLVLAAASNYFDTMFSGNFRESKTDNIVLQNIDAAIFEEILQFIYCGEVTLTKDNIFNLLLSSEFLTLVSLEENCVYFIEKNLPFPDMFKMLTYASQLRKNSLINVICQYLMQNINHHYTDPKFFQLTFDDLNALISQHWYLSPQNEGIFLGVVTRWLNFCQNKEVYFEKLKEKINFQVPIRCFSDNYLKYLTRRFTIRKPADKKPTDSLKESLNIVDKTALSQGFHVYTEGFDGITRVYSSSKTVPIWSSLCCMEFKYDHIRSIRLDGNLYCLDYIDTMPSFRICSTIDVSSPIKQLKTPPAVLMEFDMCNIKNTIYVNSSYEPTCSFKFRSHCKYSFNDNELSQGIYAYNAEIDEWYPLPLCKEISYSSAITASNNTLYLVEGLTGCGFAIPKISIQALDRRISKWQELTVVENYTGTAPLTLTCCAHEGRIYTFTGDKTSDTEFGVYDLKAGKWHKMKPPQQNSRTFRLLSYENMLWAFGRSDSYFINVETYNSFTEEWNPSPILGMIGEEYSACMDVTIFESLPGEYL